MFKRQADSSRRGIILMVVLMLLTLFAIIGVSFVLYADSEASSARLNREERTLTRPDLDPQTALSLVLGQILYGVDDQTGVNSDMRGYDLTRGVYGNYNYYEPTTGRTYAIGNSAPFTGTGRLHYTYPPTYPLKWLQNQDDWFMVNYRYFFPLTKDPNDAFYRDPDRYGPRATAMQSGQADPRGTYLGASGVPYTYPDHNNMYLGVIRASDGAVLAQSFHRPWMAFGSLDPTNPNWTTPSTGATGNPMLKYMVLRPRPAEHPNFPLPEDAGGDVKNFTAGPGYWDPITQKFCNNDSFWMDVGLPPMMGPDGKWFKMMAATLIVDLGGRLDVNAHGNVGLTGQNPANVVNLDHRSNQGFGPWEVSLKYALGANGTNGKPEWTNLFYGRRNQGTGATEAQGKYGFNPTFANPNNPTPVPTAPAASGYTPHTYSQVDFDAQNTNAGPFPTATAPYNPILAGTALFPTFPAGYDNGNTTERTYHPLIYNATRPYNGSATPAQPWAITTTTPYNLRFPASDLERLFRFNDTTSLSMTSQLERLLQMNFNDPTNAAASLKRRLLVTTDSSDRNAPGVFPYIYFSPTLTGNYQGGTVLAQPPAGPPIPFPALGPVGTNPTVTNSGEFGGDWRAALYRTDVKAALQRINLNRPLTQYPLYTGGKQTQATYAIRFDDPAQAANLPQFLQAQQDRQTLANDIYRTLLAITGVPAPAAPATPTDAELAPRRWLAQLAVNIVDYIDEDDISTPFCFYTTDDGLPAASLGAKNTNVLSTPVVGGVQDTPRYWVFGTELPHVVLNEALAEAADASAGPTPPLQPVKLWLELSNTLPAPTATTQAQDGYAVPLYIPAPAMGGLQPYSPYRIEVWNGSIANTTAVNDNVLGTVTNAPGTTTTGDTNPLIAVDATNFQTAAQIIKTSANVTALPGLPGAYVPAPTTNGGATDPAPGTLLLGPWNNPPIAAPFKDPFVAQTATPAGTVPDQTAVLRGTAATAASFMAYTGNFTAAAYALNDERTKGLTILLRRLANPHLPWNGQPTITPMGGTPQPNPAYNPYITVDYLESVPLRDPVAHPAPYASRGKRQPFGARTRLTAANAYALAADSPVADQTATSPQGVNHRFGQTNMGTLSNAGGAYDWLVFLDRQVASPMDLLHVSGFQPHQLTQQFIRRDAPPGQPSVKFRHLVPWFDPNATAAANPTSNRLYRLFEFLETNTRGAGNPRAGRHTGKININAIWDFETFAGLCDGIGGSNHFTSSGDLTNPKDVEKIYLAYMAARSPDPANGTNYVPGPVNVSAAYLKAINPNPPANPYYALNKPILPLATGLSSGSTGTPADNQNPNGRSINDTLLQQAASPATALNPPMRLFEAPGNTATTHPYQRYELLSKIFNNVTTRSNVFAVWITVGFFDYDPNTGQIGAEIGRSEGRHVRHRMFSVIDRSRVRAFTTATTGAINAVAPQQGTQAGSFAYGMQPLQLNVTAPVAGDPYNAQVITNVNTGMNWAISTQGPAGVAQALVQPLVLVYDPGLATEETVVATPVTTPVGMGGQFTTTLQAAFTKNHLKGATVQCFGHPGPWTRYDPRRDIAGVVLHYNIID